MEGHNKWPIFRGGLLPVSINQIKKKKPVDEPAEPIHEPTKPIDAAPAARYALPPGFWILELFDLDRRAKEVS